MTTGRVPTSRRRIGPPSTTDTSGAFVNPAAAARTLEDWHASVAPLRVLVVGDAMLDEYVIGESTRLAAEAPVPVVNVTTERAVLGGAANAAANVASLGGRATLIALCGADAAAGTVADLCARAGVRLVPLAERRATTRKMRIMVRGRPIARVDREEVTPLSRPAEDRLLAHVADELPSTRVVLISDYAKGLLTQRVCEGLIGAARHAAIPVVVDPRPQHGAWYSGCTYLTPNWSEGHALLGLPEPPISARAIERAGRGLVEQFQCGVILTLGSHGMAYFGPDEREPFTVRSVATQLADVCGAGDTVAATFALARAAGLDHRQAVALATRAAGVVVGKSGTATVTPAEVWRDGVESPDAACSV